MTEKENIEINFQTINSLSEKFNIKGGKWLMHYIGEYVEIIWKRIVLELVYKKFPDGVIGLKISPVNDINVPGIYYFTTRKKSAILNSYFKSIFYYMPRYDF